MYVGCRHLRIVRMNQKHIPEHWSGQNAKRMLQSDLERINNYEERKYAMRSTGIKTLIVILLCGSLTIAAQKDMSPVDADCPGRPELIRLEVEYRRLGCLPSVISLASSVELVQHSVHRIDDDAVPVLAEAKLVVLHVLECQAGPS